jgi:hypothetical protein
MGRAEGGGMRVRFFIGLIVFQVFANIAEKDNWTASLALELLHSGSPRSFETASERIELGPSFSPGWAPITPYTDNGCYVCEWREAALPAICSIKM